ncbi:glycerophosphodiester phosphodiesterase [Paenibacillus lutrae]|uniref:glycerophosphodiester phosphodiesterase n=1 Tax=Paenibacillus lutrae TaxID=2078573 RepID=UPI001F29F77B|nr:glycerophosphodiester phosphodiesterase family protein [Paenibacillus lutrae]
MSAPTIRWRPICTHGCLGGIPEGDIRTTSDGIMVCLHDETPARTTTAPDDVKDRPVSSFTFEAIRQWDEGVKFSEFFKGERIPPLKEVFEEMRGSPERLFYLDLKEVDLQQLGALIDEYVVHEQVIATHNVQDNCKRMKTIASGVRSMLGIGGSAERIQEIYLQARQSQFEGLNQIQLHLNNSGQDGDVWPYALEPAFLKDALADATDEPAKFVQSVRTWRSN